MLKSVAFALLGLTLCLGLGTFLALESGGVVTVETVDHTDGRVRLTHIWFVIENEQLILEAGNQQNPWVKDIEHQPEVKIAGENISGEYRLVIERDAMSHRRVRSLMRAKYGWRDVWVSMLFDTTKSMLVLANPN